MKWQSGDQIAERIEDLVYQDTQSQGLRFDLTVNRIFHLTGPGKLDFGGSEFERADRTEVKSRKKDPDDDYGWWILDEGTYVIEYNETVDPDPGQVAMVFPLERLLQTGASHPAFIVENRLEHPETQLAVGAGGCHLKENCRVSGVLLAE